MPPNRLPIVGQDDGTWGDILRQFLMKEHVNTDTDSPGNGGHKNITIAAGTAGTGGAPLKFTSGTLLSSPEAGAVEFVGDNLYVTQTSGTTRKKVALYDDTSGAEGDIYYRNNSGYFTRLGIGDNGDILTLSGGLPSWQPNPAADAVLTTDASTSGFGFVVDEDDMASNSATKVPTQQSTKAYVDAEILGKLDLLKLTPTSVISEDYTASAGEWVVVLGSAELTVTLPTAPPDATLVCIYIFGEGGSVTVQAGGENEWLLMNGTLTSYPLASEGSMTIAQSLWTFNAATSTWLPVVFSTLFRTDTLPGAGEVGISLMESEAAADALTAIGITATTTELNYTDGVTSNIQTQLNAKAALSHTHTASQISDSTITGRSVLTAADAAAARTAIGAGTGSGDVTTSGSQTLTNKTIDGSDNNLSNISADSLTDGLTNRVFTSSEKTKLANIESGADVTDAANVAAAGAVMEGDPRLTDARTPTTHSHPAAQISDATTVGRNVLTASSQANARSAIGAGTSNLTLGTTAGTAAAGNDSRLSDQRVPTDNSVSAAKIQNGAVTTGKIGDGQVTEAKLDASILANRPEVHVGTSAPGDTSMLWVDTN